MRFSRTRSTKSVSVHEYDYPRYKILESCLSFLGWLRVESSLSDLKAYEISIFNILLIKIQYLCLGELVSFSRRYSPFSAVHNTTPISTIEAVRTKQGWSTSQLLT